jgi:hypothetical protein
MLQYQFRPIDQWPGKATTSRGPSPFRAPWSSTLDLLERELRHLHAKDVVLQADVELREIRNDGMLRSDARPRSPRVILAFTSKHGDLSYACDRYRDWQGNVRAIALTLESLRAVERYGATRGGEQYKGWAKLPPPPGGIVAFDNINAAASFLLRLTKQPPPLRKDDLADIYRAACVKTHPDHGGDQSEFKKVQTAKEMLDRHFGNLQ